MSSSYGVSTRRLDVRLRASGYAQKAVANPIVAYVAVAALQLRVIWNVWKYADLTNGDTSFYFLDAASWTHGLHENIVYYPFYDAFWGTILAVTHDVYASTIIQRVAIIFAATLLILAVMRALVGPVLGLLIAAWWAVVPANYDVLYEVHLLGAVPILLAVLIVARSPGRKGLGIAVAILLASAVLVRTELIAAAAILGAAVLVYEVRQFRDGQRASKSAYLTAYVLPLAIACLLIGGAYARSHVQGKAAWEQLQAKEEDSFCNNYAASYQQRHPTLFSGNPFTECSSLMMETFGHPMPSLLEASTANPRAVAGFMAWDAQLLPGGLQVSMFGASAFENDPGFHPVTENSTYALILSVALLCIVIAGLGIAAREGKLSPRRASTRTRWIFITLVSIAVATLLVVLTTRPWAEYMYGLTICALALIGVSASVLLSRFGGTRILAPAALVVVVALIAAFPSFYTRGPRPIYEGVQHLKLLQAPLQRPGSVLVTQENANEICNYLAYTYERVCTATSWPELSSQVTAGVSAGEVLDRARATAVYVESGMLADPAVAHLVAAPGSEGWRAIAHGRGLDGPWEVLVPADRSA